MKPLRVAIVTPYFEPASSYGGPTVAIGNLARGLSRVGACVTVLTTDADGVSRIFVEPDRYLRDGVRVATAPRSSAAGLGRMWRRFNHSSSLSRLLDAHIPLQDACLLQGVWTFASFRAARACERHGVTAIITPRGMLEKRSMSEQNLKKRLGRIPMHRMLNRAAALHFTSEFERQNSIYPSPCKTFVVENGFDFGPPVSKSVRTQGHRLRCLLAGRIHPRKGIEIALSALADTKHDVELSLAGPDEDGYLATLLEKARSLAVESRVRYLGNIERERLMAVYREHDLLITPSLGESFGNSVVESLSQGTPVLASPFVPTAVWGEANGLARLSPLNSDAWASALDRLAKDWPFPSPSSVSRKTREHFGLNSRAMELMSRIRFYADSTRT